MTRDGHPLLADLSRTVLGRRYRVVVLLAVGETASVANVYLAGWDSLEVPIQPLRDRGWSVEADAIAAQLQALTHKRLTPKAPNIPSPDAVAGWAVLRVLLTQTTALYHSAHT